MTSAWGQILKKNWGKNYFKNQAKLCENNWFWVTVFCSLHVKVSKRAAKWVYTRESNHGLKTGAVLRLVSHGWPVSIGHNPAWSLVVTFMILKIFWNRIVNKCTYFLSTISGSMWHWVKASLMVSISSSAYTLGQ